MNKELAPKTKVGICDGNKSRGFRRGITVDMVTIAYHSRFRELIRKRNSNFYCKEIRDNIYQRNTRSTSRNKLNKNCFICFMADMEKVKVWKEEMEQFIAR